MDGLLTAVRVRVLCKPYASTHTPTPTPLIHPPSYCTPFWHNHLPALLAQPSTCTPVPTSRSAKAPAPNSSLTSSAAGPIAVVRLHLAGSEPRSPGCRQASPRSRLRPHQPSAPLSQAWPCQARPTARWARQAGGSVCVHLAWAVGSVAKSRCCMHSAELQTAATKGDTKTVVALLARGADVHCKNSLG